MQEKWCNVHLAYHVINGEFFTMRMMFTQISAMLLLKSVAYYATSFVRDGFHFQDTSYECPLDSIKTVGTRGNVTGTTVREHSGTYFTSPLGSVLGQYKNF